MQNILQVTPFLNVDDFAATLTFWRDLLGFTVTFQTESFAYVEREGAGVRIFENGPPYRGHRPIGKPWNVYIDLRDVAPIVAEVTSRLPDFPESDTHGPVDQQYGQREFMVMSPSGYVVVFGQSVQTAAPQPPSQT